MIMTTQETLSQMKQRCLFGLIVITLLLVGGAVGVRMGRSQAPFNARHYPSLVGFTIEDAAQVSEDGDLYPALLLRKSGSWDGVAGSLAKELKPGKVIKQKNGWLLIKEDNGLNTVVSVGSGKGSTETVGANSFANSPTGIVKVLIYWRRP